MYVRSGSKSIEFVQRTWVLQLAILAVAVSASAFDLFVLRDVGVTIPTQVVSILGTALAFFIGFINNQAYDRWWEARKIWGAFVNDSRNFGHMAAAYLTPPEGTEPAEVELMKRRLVQRHLAFLKATIARLREVDDSAWQSHLTAVEKLKLQHHGHLPNGIALMQREALKSARTKGYCDGFEFLAMNRMLDGFFDDIGKAERIKTTIFPLAHVALTRVSLWLFILLLPMTLAEHVGWWAVLFTWILGQLYVFTFAAGQALVNPFANRPSDTPMSTITRAIEMNLLDVLDEEHRLDALKTVEGTHKM